MLKKVLRITFKSLFYVVCAFVILLICLNAVKYPIYNNYFKIKEDLITNRGLGDGFVPQGIAVTTHEDQKVYVSSGYMSNDKPSRLYVMSDSRYYYVEVKLDDSTLCYDHLGGIAITEDKIYLTGEYSIYELLLEDLFLVDPILSEKDKEIPNQIKIKNVYQLDVSASFVYADSNDSYLYVGEFNHGPYQTNHDTLVNEGTETYHAYVRRYPLINNPDMDYDLTYAIRDKVQGFALADNKIVLSTSYGLSASTIYTYTVPQEEDEEGICYLDDRYLTDSIKAPAMMEALDYCAETKQFITLYESACNKYFFGKFFFANKIVGLKL